MFHKPFLKNDLTESLQTIAICLLVACVEQWSTSFIHIYVYFYLNQLTDQRIKLKWK